MYTSYNQDMIGDELISSLRGDGIYLSEDIINGARRGDDNEMIKIGFEYYQKKSYVKALNWFLKAALKNNHTAQTNVGIMYCFGQGVSINYKLAMEWFLKATSNGDHSAKNSIGWMYHMGLGVPVNYKLAMEWYLEAVSNGDKKAINNIGEMYLDGSGVDVDYRQAMNLFQQADVDGDSEATCNIGWMYHNGYGVPRNYNLAMEWYQKTIQKGESKGYTRMGLLYQHGLGVLKDLRYALTCLQEGADLGTYDYLCNYELAYFYENEEGFKNKELAIKYYTKASTFGYKKAEEALGRIKKEEAEQIEKKKRELQQNSDYKPLPKLAPPIPQRPVLSRNSDTVSEKSDDQTISFLAKKFSALEVRMGEVEKASSEKDEKIKVLEEMLARSNKENKYLLQKLQDKIDKNSNNEVSNNRSVNQLDCEDPNYNSLHTSDQDDPLNDINYDSDSASSGKNDINYDSDEA